MKIHKGSDPLALDLSFQDQEALTNGQFLPSISAVPALVHCPCQSVLVSEKSVESSVLYLLAAHHPLTAPPTQVFTVHPTPAPASFHLGPSCHVPSLDCICLSKPSLPGAVLSGPVLTDTLGSLIPLYRLNRPGDAGFLPPGTSLTSDLVWSDHESASVLQALRTNHIEN
jgi:hypothetical protein